MLATSLNKYRMHWSAIAFATLFAFTASISHAQYGFVPNPTFGNSYGNVWGNYYTSSTIQVPSWGSGWTNTPTYSYPWTNNWQGWQLGAVIQNTPSGVLIQQVAPGGVADRAGLKPGDVIVSVAGTQVGYSNGRVVDLIYEINRRVNANGQVRLTVLDSAIRQLRTVDLNISQRPTASGIVSGRLFVDSNALAYGNSTIKVELLNTTRPYLNASGGNTYVQAYGPGPFPFSIYTNPSYLNVTDRYRLVATLYDVNRQVIAYSTLDIAAPVAGNSANYDLRLQSTPTSVPNYGASYGYYYPSQNAVYDTFRQYLNRDPSASEAQAWQQQLAYGSSNITEMKAEIIASPAFYDRVGNNPDQFIKLMIESTTRSAAPFEKIQYWRSRLDAYGGDRINTAREYVQSAG